MLIYSVLYLTGYDLTLDDLKQFRQWESKTPGHPEYGYTPGVETTTGPLGQGIGNAVGMAVGEAHWARVFNRDQKIIDHNVYFIASDGDMMEGVSHEAASFAGHAKLGKLIGFYDDNHITIEGDTALTFSDDTGERFEAYGWHVQHVADVNDLAALNRAIDAAKAETSTPVAHHRPLAHRLRKPAQARHRRGARFSARRRRRSVLTKQALDYPSAGAVLRRARSARVLARHREATREIAKTEWKKIYDAYKAGEPRTREGAAAPPARELPDGWEELDSRVHRPRMATSPAALRRASSSTPSRKKIPGADRWLGGSRQSPPTRSSRASRASRPSNYGGRNFHFGIREHGMGAIMNGMSLHRRNDSLRRDIPDFLRLHASAGQARVHHGAARHLRLHPRFDRTWRRRTDPSADRAAECAARDSQDDLDQAGRCIGDRRSLAGCAQASKVRSRWCCRGRSCLSSIARNTRPPRASTRGAYVLADAPGGAPEIVLMSSGSEVGTHSRRPEEARGATEFGLGR